MVVSARPGLRRGDVLVDVAPVEAVVGEVAVAVEVEVRDPVTSLLAVVLIAALQDDGRVVAEIRLALSGGEAPGLRLRLRRNEAQTEDAEDGRTERTDDCVAILH